MKDIQDKIKTINELKDRNYAKGKNPFRGKKEIQEIKKRPDQGFASI